MVRLKLVKICPEEDVDNIADDENGWLYGTKVIISWANSDCIICAYSYFAWVGAAEMLKRIRLHFIGVLK